MSTDPDVSYKEMAGHCEALLLGKQQKMSELMSSQKKQECLMTFSLQNHNDEVKEMTSDSHIAMDSHRVLFPGYNLRLGIFILITS